MVSLPLRLGGCDDARPSYCNRTSVFLLVGNEARRQANVEATSTYCRFVAVDSVFNPFDLDRWIWHRRHAALSDCIGFRRGWLGAIS